MKKFNKMESDLLVSSLKFYVANLESEIKQMEKDSKRSIFAQGFYTQISKELKDKVKTMTKKQKPI